MSKRKGFTIIEVIMFMAISAALFIGVAVGMQNSIFQQRYNDTTQSFLEFLRSVYSEVLNPQSEGAGNSNIALYGKLIVFGENTEITGESISGGGDRPIFTYDVVGDAEANVGVGSVSNTLQLLNANVLRLEYSGSNVTSVESIEPEKYTPHFGAYIESTTKDSNGNNVLYEGSILIVRHPGSGTVNTLKLSIPIQVNKVVKDAKATLSGGGFVPVATLRTLLTQYLADTATPHFETGEIDFCVNPYAETMPSDAVTKRNIRIMDNARNVSGIELIDLDSIENRCK